MPKLKLIWLGLAGFLLFVTLAWAAQPQDFTVSYQFKNQDQSVFRIIKYHLRGGKKFRVDYLSGDGAANAINIYLKDQGLIWTLDPTSKQYAENPLEQSEWERALTGVIAIEADKPRYH